MFFIVKDASINFTCYSRALIPLSRNLWKPATQILSGCPGTLRGVLHFQFGSFYKLYMLLQSINSLIKEFVEACNTDTKWVSRHFERGPTLSVWKLLYRYLSLLVGRIGKKLGLLMQVLPNCSPRLYVKPG